MVNVERGMSTSYILKCGAKVLGTLKPYDLDQPFINCKFEPAEAYADFKPLFDAELQELEKDEDLDHWQRLYQKIFDLGLRLESEDGSEQINEFLLHIQDNEAWFRY